MQYTKSVLLIISALSALTAALFWYISAIAKVRNVDQSIVSKESFNPEIYAVDNIGDYEIVRTLTRQSVWSRWAALAAGISALFQAAALLVPQLEQIICLMSGF